MWLSKERGEVGGSHTDSLPLAVHGGVVPADSEIALSGSKQKERRIGMVLILPSLPCLPGT